MPLAALPCCNYCGSLGPRLSVLVLNTIPVTALGSINVQREDPSSTAQFFGFLPNDLGPLRPSDTHSCGFTLDLVITISCGPPESTCKHPMLWSPPPTILLSSLDLSYLELQTYGYKSQLDTPTWMSDRQLTCKISKTELLISPLSPNQLPLSSGRLEPGVDQNWNHLRLFSLSWPISNLLANTLGSTFKTCLKYKYNLSKISCKP